ncbi:HlyD family efflux transporter periplasmic adaptor subunit [Janthinobacterium sp. JC611]|uniref:HlyD family secretion protein n=1 Tax=Janthinobacterium sp. JC611 TaxID=2816201 RepID=UPI001BFD2756|nr:HlyD family efflux transporter periplasmic adaptor subunit [Janthinobacterium sp. JC611]
MSLDSSQREQQVESVPSIATRSASQPLFRPEILAAQGAQWLGAIRLIQPISSGLIAVVAGFIALSMIGFITLGSYGKKAHVAGMTVARGGSLSISAANAGIVVRAMVVEGQQVQAGEPLFELSTERQGNNGELSALIAQQLLVRRETLEAERRTRVTQGEERRRALDARLVNLQAELEQLEVEMALAKRRHGLALTSVEKYETLQRDGFVSAAQTQQKQEDLLDLATRQSALSRSKVQLGANRLSLQGERDDLSRSLATELSQLDRARAVLAQEVAENQSRKASLVTAPRNGTVTTITYQAGQAVNAGQVLATLLSDATDNSSGALEVHLYAASRTAGFVAAGQQVLIRYQAFPYQKFGLQDGVVTDVSKTPFAPAELPANMASTILSNAQQSILGFNGNEALYRIKVRLAKQSVDTYGKQQALKPGMTLEADVLQDRRMIWEWIAEPLLAIAHR